MYVVNATALLNERVREKERENESEREKERKNERKRERMALDLYVIWRGKTTFGTVLWPSRTGYTCSAGQPNADGLTGSALHAVSTPVINPGTSERTHCRPPEHTPRNTLLTVFYSLGWWPSL